MPQMFPIPMLILFFAIMTTIFLGVIRSFWVKFYSSQELGTTLKYSTCYFKQNW